LACRPGDVNIERMTNMPYEDLNEKEREIANTLCDDPLLKVAPVPQGTVYWAAKLASLVDTNAPRVADLYKALRYCLFCEAWTRAMSPYMLEHYASIESVSTWGPEGFREWERWLNAHKQHGVNAKLSAYRAAEIVASIHGVSIETDTLSPKGNPAAHTTEGVLKAAYHALVATIGVPGL
jgi:hypothetical protein